MAREPERSDLAGLPEEARAFIRHVIRKMRYRKKVRAEVQAELVAHFEDELKDCQTPPQREEPVGQGRRPHLAGAGNRVCLFSDMLWPALHRGSHRQSRLRGPVERAGQAGQRRVA